MIGVDVKRHVLRKSPIREVGEAVVETGRILRIQFRGTSVVISG